MYEKLNLQNYDISKKKYLYKIKWKRNLPYADAAMKLATVDLSSMLRCLKKVLGGRAPRPEPISSVWGGGGLNFSLSLVLILYIAIGRALKWKPSPIPPCKYTTMMRKDNMNCLLLLTSNVIYQGLDNEQSIYLLPNYE